MTPHTITIRNRTPYQRVPKRLSEQGNSLIELALTLPLFILVLLGTAVFAQFAWAAVLVSSAARAGASYGSQNSITAQDATGISNAAANDSASLTGLSTSSSVSCYCSTAQATSISCSNDLALCPSPAVVIKFVQVTTSAQVQSTISYSGLPRTFTSTGNSLMQVVGP